MASKKSDSSYSHIMKYTGLFGSVQAISILVNVVRTKIVAVLLGPIGVGMVSLFNSAIKFVGDITNLGIAMSAVKDVSKAFEDGDRAAIERAIIQVRSWCFVGAIIGMIACALFSPLLNRVTFDWGDHTLHFVLLSPAVALTTLLGGELAILKGTRHLMDLAKISIYGVLLSLVISVPIYMRYNISGIVPVLFLIALAQFLIAFRYSTRISPYRLQLRSRQLSAGQGMVRLGLSFVLATVMASGADFVIRAFINYSSQVDLGLYNAGFVIAVIYASTVFSAMESDYYPRLSSKPTRSAELNSTVNRQIEVSVLIVAPMLVFLIFSMPVIIPLLFSREFNAVIGMSQIAALGMIFRGIYLPIEYIPLSRGDSMKYFVQEAISAFMLVASVVGGYHLFGLTGAGIGIAVCAIAECVFVMLLTNHFYDYRPSREVVRYLGIQLIIIAAAYYVALNEPTGLYWVAGTSLFVLSMIISLYTLKDKYRRTEPMA